MRFLASLSLTAIVLAMAIQAEADELSLPSNINSLLSTEHVSIAAEGVSSPIQSPRQKQHLGKLALAKLAFETGKFSKS